MRHTKYAAKLPTRTTLRKTATRTRAATVGHAPSVVAVLAATATMVAVAAVVGFALAVVVATLPSHPGTLLAGVFVVTFALYTVPLLALRAVSRAVQATRTTA
jgi:uncharacterized RDD family membrane protein YckC